ncbi:MAG TPA: YcxB family protein [Thermoanaerobaculia bacterium]|jgi:hypothetical protein|nr:YcxB family protein [Thermoanaerobaculia bacterium]
MTIEYTNTLNDLVRFNLYHASRRVLNWVIIVGAALFLSRTSPSDQPGGRVAAFLIFAICMSLVLFGATALISCVSYMPSKNRGILGKHRLTLTAETLAEETPVSEGTWSWVGIQKVSRNSAYVFIYVQQNMAHIVPARSFPNRAEADRFWQFAVDTWKTARVRA